MLFLAAEIDVFKWNCVRALEPSLKTLWRHWLYSRIKRYGVSLVFTWFIQVYSSYYRYLLVLHLVISVQPWQKIHIIDVRGHQSVDLPKWMLQIRTAQYILFDYLEYRKRHCSISAFNSRETGIALGDLDALDIARQVTRENNLAAGKTSVKELILPTNFCSDFKDTVLLLSRSSLREANLIFLSGGIKNAVLTESMIYPRKIGACVGIRVDFWRPMKQPSSMRM